MVPTHRSGPGEGRLRYAPRTSRALVLLQRGVGVSIPRGMRAKQLSDNSSIFSPLRRSGSDRTIILFLNLAVTRSSQTYSHRTLGFSGSLKTQPCTVYTIDKGRKSAPNFANDPIMPALVLFR